MASRTKTSQSPKKVCSHNNAAYVVIVYQCLTSKSCNVPAYSNSVTLANVYGMIGEHAEDAAAAAAWLGLLASPAELSFSPQSTILPAQKQRVTYFRNDCTLHLFSLKQCCSLLPANKKIRKHCCRPISSHLFRLASLTDLLRALQSSMSKLLHTVRAIWLLFTGR
jgi:hypothetical protein